MKALNAAPIIDVIAPAGKIKLPAEIPLVEDQIKQWGFQPRLGANLLSNHPFLSNSVENRLQDLKKALYATDSKVIWCYRGGSGCAELLPLLATLSPPSHQKIFLGFSDITALVIFLHVKWGWQTYHGPGAKQILPEILDSQSLDYVKSLFAQHTTNLIIDDLVPLNATAKKPFEMTSSVIGGNLAVIAHMLGTPYQPDPAHKILILEDVNEPAYKIRRMLTQLTQVGLFNHIQALLFGEFLTPNDDERAWIKNELLEFASHQPFPVLQTNCIGHGKRNTVIPFGKDLTLTHQKLRSMTYE